MDGNRLEFLLKVLLDGGREVHEEIRSACADNYDHTHYNACPDIIDEIEYQYEVVKLNNECNGG